MGWVISWFVVFLAVAGVQITTCTQGSEDAWVASSVFYTPLAIALLVVILATKSHHVKYVSLSIPLFLVLPYCAIFTVPFLIGNTFHGTHLCSVLLGEPMFNGYSGTWWLRAWAPMEILLIVTYSWVAFSCWRARIRRSPANYTLRETPAERTPVSEKRLER
jgi:hypothetical protein